MGKSTVNSREALSQDEAYELIKQYVRYFWQRGKFYSLAGVCGEEDVVQEVYLKMFSGGYFTKYDPAVTSKKYYVMNIVKTVMIDLLRKTRETDSLEATTSDGLSLMDKVPSGQDLEEEVVGALAVSELFRLLPNETRSKIVGNSPVLGQCAMSLRNVAYHLALGYKPKEIAEIYGVTAGRIHQLLTDLRQRLAVAVDLA